MCLLAFAWKQHPDYPLILAANRDELRARPTAEADWWHDAPDVLGGRDLEAGGTWLGITSQGRFAALTNFRERRAPPANASSRGQLVADYLMSQFTPTGFAQELQRMAGRFAGFSLIFGNPQELHYFSNRSESGGPIAPGVHTLSNHLLDTPWPKSERLRQDFVEHFSQADPERLFTLLDDTAPAADGDLPDTGLDYAIEKRLSAPCVVGEEYGTRCSTVLLLRRGGHVLFAEAQRDHHGRREAPKIFQFDLENA